MYINYVQAINKKYNIKLRIVKTKNYNIFLKLCDKLKNEKNYYKQCEIKKILLNNFLYEYDSKYLKIKKINNDYIICEKINKNNWIFSMKNNLNMDLKYIFNFLNDKKYKNIFLYIKRLYNFKLDIKNMILLYSLEDENNFKESYYEMNEKIYVLLENKNTKILNLEQ